MVISITNDGHMTGIDSLDSMPGCSVSAIVEEIGNADSEPGCSLSDIVGEIDSEDSEPGCSLSAIVGEIDSEDSETEFVGIDNENLEPSEIIGNNSNFQGNSDIKGKCEDIKSWAVRNKISQTALEDLLHTLNRVGVEDLPLSAKTLFNTSIQKFFFQALAKLSLLQKVLRGLYRLVVSYFDSFLVQYKALKAKI
ncbi:hypothetical protein FF38_09590 [Lucilia cuprina]|uniref:Uncharacterized protein n=1 Tax=Lucilia cuprina TaxID=7375 RepID=A0A0L0CNZ6_LUCCU|nr:hypothetical protein FF38_09590 [Lucilia cuprina]